VLVAAARPASEVLACFRPWPQLLRNVRADGAVLERDSVRAAIAGVEAALGGEGRLLVRKSGTEPLIRVMAEGLDEALVRHAVDSVCRAVEVAA